MKIVDMMEKIFQMRTFRDFSTQQLLKSTRTRTKITRKIKETMSLRLFQACLSPCFIQARFFGDGLFFTQLIFNSSVSFKVHIEFWTESMRGSLRRKHWLAKLHT